MGEINGDQRWEGGREALLHFGDPSPNMKIPFQGSVTHQTLSASRGFLVSKAGQMKRRVLEVVPLLRRNCLVHPVKVFLSLLKSLKGAHCGGQREKIFLLPEKNGNRAGINDFHHGEPMI